MISRDKLETPLGFLIQKGSSLSKLELVALVSVGVAIGNLLSTETVTSLPSYLWSYCRNSYQQYQFKRKYQKYLMDTSIDKLELNKEGRNILLLCHGRNYPIVHTDLIDYEKDTVITIDISENVSPHIVADLSKYDCFKQIKDKSIDIIVFHTCSCHTTEIENSPNFADECIRILKQRGEMWIASADDMLKVEWLEDKFKFVRRMTSKSEETAPKIPQFWSRYHNRIYSINRTWYFQVLTAKV